MTDRYTPSTQEVRDTWRIHGGYGIDAESDFDRWLDATIRAARAEAWEEGFSAGYDAAERDIAPSRPRNPFKESADV